MCLKKKNKIFIPLFIDDEEQVGFLLLMWENDFRIKSARNAFLFFVYFIFSLTIIRLNPQGPNLPSDWLFVF